MTQQPSYDTEALEVATTFVSVPTDYSLVDASRVTQDERPVWVFRHERADGHNIGFGGEHVSFVADAETSRLLGVTRMQARLAGGDLPDRGTARDVADEFIAEAAPDLDGTLDVLWIEPHDETITTDGHEVVISGMKVKCRDPTGTYAWVIIGPENEVITFERDIIWNDDMSRRQTEQWLHDDWRA
ncbi:hypothetical protein [Natrialba aegyptia]|uniref:Uncharacterized protein n=1 Tax=Natrialba aegyptia DSM 13077 TaxID=1227491 RepID=M0ARD5_9EURY|nr:hypothetical protein [Natrialba aegyptia]ELY99943.1 hypothetical protein C480_19359 [Natrialba aegyptia DSM 13077]